MKSRVAIAVSVAVAGAFAVGVALAEEAAKAESAVQKAYAKKCASCHGADAKGSEKMAKMFKLETSALDLVSEKVLAQKDEDLLAVITKGKGKMPAFGEKLSKEELAALPAYIRSLAPKKEGAPKKEEKAAEPAGK